MAKTRETTLASDDASGAVISRRNVLKLGALGVGGLALGRGFLAHDRESLRSVNFATKSAANQTLRVGTSIPLSTLDPNLIDTAAFPYRRALFDPLLSENITNFKAACLEPADSLARNQEQREQQLHAIYVRRAPGCELLGRHAGNRAVHRQVTRILAHTRFHHGGGAHRD